MDDTSLSAIEAARLTVQTSGHNHTRMAQDFQTIMKKVHADIRQYCTCAGREMTHLDYKWNVARPNEYNDIFGDVKHSLYHWDGGEGRTDKITPLGTMVQEALTGEGYQVSLCTGSLSISWQHLIEEARNEP